ncbi:glycosyltransferase family 2 protein [Candidatus Micrarchaeota archaeon]|nr:glycosyltransferase family 2 protein [Candidatus Micrarchaeota archaeon]
MNSEISVVIPAKDEINTLLGITKELKKMKVDILVVAAKKADGIVKICKREKIECISNGGNGKGDAIRAALERIKSRYVVFMDADGSHDTEDIEPMIKELKKSNADMVIGSRFTGGSEELYDGSWDGFFRSFFTLCINQIVNTRFGVKITDTQNGFRAAKTQSLRELNLKSEYFEIETEECMKMLKKGRKIKEIPAKEYARKEGKSGVSILRHGWRYFLCVILNL